MASKTIGCTAKFYGGPRDGDTMPLPDKRPELLRFSSMLLNLEHKRMTHFYARVASYKAAGYQVNVYIYQGVWASDSTTPHPRPARGPKLGPVDIEGEL